MKRADLKHLRRLVAWVQCEIGQSPEELVATTRTIADKLGNPELDHDAQVRMVQAHDRARAVPAYVRAAVKALDQMDNTVTRAELAALLDVVEAAGKPRGNVLRLYSHEKVAADRERLRVARRAVHKLHRLFKRGSLQELQVESKPAGDAGVRDELLRALIEGPHVVTDDAVVLNFDARQPGHNALNQLLNRLEQRLAAGGPP